MTKLRLIGTHPYDVESQRKIVESLEAFNPTHVLVEGCRNAYTVCLLARDATTRKMKESPLHSEVTAMLLQDLEVPLRAFGAAEAFAEGRKEVLVDFFDDEAVDDMSVALLFLNREILGRIDEVARMSWSAQQPLAKRHELEKAQTIRQVREGWLELGGGSNEARLRIWNPEDDQCEMLGFRDSVMYDRLASLVRSNPDSRIATVTDAVHIARDKDCNSLYDRVMKSRKFNVDDVERDMIFARD